MEREETIELGRDNGLGVLKAYLEGRGNIYLWMRDVVETKHAAAAAAIDDDVQKHINRQLGVSDELFRKYYH